VQTVIVRSVYRLNLSGSMIGTVMSILGRAGFNHWNEALFDPLVHSIDPIPRPESNIGPAVRSTRRDPPVLRNN
jgi:hypothetical protein